VTAAVAFLGADALMLARQQSSLETAKQEIAPQLDLVTARKVHLHNSGVASFSVNAAATMLATHGGDRTAWKAMLGEISRITPQQITLLEINSLSAADSKRATVINLRGMAKFAESDDPLSQYIETLSASPLFESVKLVSTRTETEVTRSFLIAAYPRTLPFLLPWESAAADRGVSP
jgi:Tfp pilus assembly protein PilN